MSKLVSIVYKPRHLEAKPATHFSRVPLEEANLVVGHGIEGDVKGGHPTRQINIMAQETLDELVEQGYKVGPGEMGEQMIIAGVELSSLSIGTQLQLGDAARVEVTAFRSGCVRLETLQGREEPTGEIEASLGVMARVLAGGVVRVGDSVQVVTQAQR
jgi:MOSC domain-containing protein YiiM